MPMKQTATGADLCEKVKTGAESLDIARQILANLVWLKVTGRNNDVSSLITMDVKNTPDFIG
jgi:hypothetical protein